MQQMTLAGPSHHLKAARMGLFAFITVETDIFCAVGRCEKPLSPPKKEKEKQKAHMGLTCFSYSHSFQLAVKAVVPPKSLSNKQLREKVFAVL